MKIQLKISLLCCLLCIALCASCSLQPHNPQARIKFETLASQSSTATIYLEGADGNLLTGALVTITNTSNVSALVPFVQSEWAYSASIPVSSDGKYALTIQSQAMSQSIVQTITHKVLTVSPEISLLQDESAHSALDGLKLNIAETMNIEWNASTNATVYQVRITKSSGQELLVKSEKSTATSVKLSDLGPAGVYFVTITAQFIDGDPLLQKYNYYSISEKAGGSYMFQTQ